MSNYTPEETEQLKELYKQLGTSGIDEISAKLGKTRKSVIAKLSREKVYVKADKNNSDKVTKKVLVRKLAELIGKPLNGIEAAEKQSLLEVLEYIESLKERVEHDC